MVKLFEHAPLMNSSAEGNPEAGAMHVLRGRIHDRNPPQTRYPSEHLTLCLSPGGPGPVGLGVAPDTCIQVFGLARGGI